MTSNTQIVLTKHDYEQLLALVDRPPEPTEEQARYFKEYLDQRRSRLYLAHD